MRVSDVSPSEYNPYYGTYIKLAEKHELISGLQNGLNDTIAFFESIPNGKLAYRYDEGKWTVKEILRHIIDTERIFAYRALRFARNDKTALSGFEQDEYIRPAKVDTLSLEHLIDEYKTNRLSTKMMFMNFSEDMLKQIGEASGNPMSTRAAGFVIIGHEKHHCQIIRDRYL